MPIVIKIEKGMKYMGMKYVGMKYVDTGYIDMFYDRKNIEQGMPASRTSSEYGGV